MLESRQMKSLEVEQVGRERSTGLGKGSFFVRNNVRVLLCVAVIALLVGLPSYRVAGQSTEKQQEKPAGQPPAKSGDRAKDQPKENKQSSALSPVEAIVETAILVHGGRAALKTARSGVREEGTIRLATDDGEISGSYLLRQMRKEKSWEDLLRTDLELNTPENMRPASAPASLKYVVAYNGASVWAARNGQYITAQPQTELAFKAQLTHGYDTLLRYKEDGSKLELVGSETVTGVETNVIDLTTPNGEKTRYWLSKKFFRVLHLEYELTLPKADKPTKFHVSFFPPLKVVQNTLVPARRVTLQDGKFAQEIAVSSITLSAKLNPEIFQYLQNE
ncbi:MAG TPA: hypothetical protein VFV34_29125 [Blastocatellia bacterium]|nr:hypothetical protein [Blastocatellia bacterium]